nr:uncharacterized protein LOC109729384 [Microcebus murinus]
MDPPVNPLPSTSTSSLELLCLQTEGLAPSQARSSAVTPGGSAWRYRYRRAKSSVRSAPACRQCRSLPLGGPLALPTPDRPGPRESARTQDFLPKLQNPSGYKDRVVLEQEVGQTWRCTHPPKDAESETQTEELARTSRVLPGSLLEDSAFLPSWLLPDSVGPSVNANRFPTCLPRLLSTLGEKANDKMAEVEMPGGAEAAHACEAALTSRMCAAPARRLGTPLIVLVTPVRILTVSKQVEFDLRQGDA